MTNVDIDVINGVTVVSVSGHAEYSNNGNDIVCAAISTITQSLLNTLKYYEQQDKCKLIDEQIFEEAGVALFSFKTMDKKITNSIMKMAEVGYLMIKNSYPKNISVNINE